MLSGMLVKGHDTGREMKGRTYHEATDMLLTIPGFHMRMLAERLGVSLNTVNRARMEGKHSRPPPKGWEDATTDLALECAEAHKRHAAGAFSVWRALSTGAGK